MLGTVIAFDGIDGCGKSSQLKLVHDWLSVNYPEIPISCYKEPWRDEQSPFGMYIDGVLTKKIHDIDPALEPTRFQKYYLADRLLLWTLELIDRKEEGHIVLFDRDRMSTMAFGHAFGLSIHEVLRWHRLIPSPDLYFFFRVKVRTALSRMSGRTKEKEYFEEEERLEKIARSFEKAVSFGLIQNLQVISGEGTPKQVLAEMIPILEEQIPRLVRVKG